MNILHRTIDGIEHKLCKKCDTWKSLLFFSSAKQNKDGQKNKCRDCERKANKKQYVAKKPKNFQLHPSGI